jgi:major membrane immunogen (membrane-anchored lipoprotein)
MKSSISAIGSVIALSFVLASCGAPVTVRDGTYTQHQTYKAGDKGEYEFYMDVTATLADNKIAAIEVVPDSGEYAKTVQGYAAEFKKSLQSEIVGKTLDEAKKLGYVSGASLASQAFTDALSAIEVQASGTGATTPAASTGSASTGSVSTGTVSTGSVSTGSVQS